MVKSSRIALILSVAVAVVAGAVTMPSDAQAEELEFEFGVTAGANWNVLGQPEDPEGEFTFLWGSAFTGFGGVVGPTVAMDVADFDGTSLMVTADGLFGYHRGAGFADHGDAGRIEVTLTSYVLRMPVIARFRSDASDLRPSIGVGLEPIIGLSSGSRVVSRGIDADIQDVETTTASAVAGVATAGLEFDTDEGHPVLFDARAVWNPSVGASTEERFDDFQSPEDPGAFQVAFNWQFMLTLGVRFD